MNLHTIISRNPKIVSGEIAKGEEEVLLHLDTTAYHSLNKVGTLIWEMLETPMSLGDVVNRIKESVEGTPATLEQEITAFVQGLADRDLVILEQPDRSG
jgi:hypothetical protein